MKDEIKEIKISKSNHSIVIIKNGVTVKEQFAIDDEILDYITNLQEKNKEWSTIFDTFSKRPYAHKYLEEKKKELGNKKIIGLDSEMIYKDYYDYKSRNEKAIKYLVSHCVISDEWTEVEPLIFVPTGHISYKPCGKKHTENLLNILTGGDKE